MCARSCRARRRRASFTSIRIPPCVRDTLQAALRSAGAGVLATDLVMAGEVENAFCAVRPPGHHAERAKAMGFCFFNNVAVAARHALDSHGLERVAIIDFDVHHGNGTEDIFAGDERVLMVSTLSASVLSLQRHRQSGVQHAATCRCRREPAAMASARS